MYVQLYMHAEAVGVQKLQEGFNGADIEACDEDLLEKPSDGKP